MRTLLAALLMVAFMTANVSCNLSFFTQSFGWSTSGVPIKEFIEVDTKQNIEVFRVKQGNQPDDALQAVLDFEKGLIAIYIPSVKGCYLIGGIDQTIEKPKELKDTLKAKSSEGGNTLTELSYVIRKDYTVTDKSLVPSKLSNVCKDRPVYWLERAGEKTTNIASNQRSRRQGSTGCTGCFGTHNWMVTTNIVNVHGGTNNINMG